MSAIPLKCGHASNAVDGDGNPSCAICLCSEPLDERPSLEGRIAKCSYKSCLANARRSRARSRGGSVDYGAVPKGKSSAEAASDWDLPFFNHKPDSEYDEYYCGCFGWG